VKIFGVKQKFTKIKQELSNHNNILQL
jgi:hypothetical protein